MAAEHNGIAGHVSSLLEQLPQGIVLTDAQLRVVEASPRAALLCGAPTGEALQGESLETSPFFGDLLSKVDLRTLLYTTGATKITFSPAAKAGNRDMCDCSIVPVRDKDNRPGLLLFLTDLRERTRLEESLVQAEKLAALDSIIAGVAHELNNPLTAILGYTELLLAGELTPPLRRRLAAISEEAERCRQIVTNLHKFAQQERKPKTLTNLNRLLQDTLDLLVYQVTADGIDVETDFAEHLPEAPVHPQELQRAIINIITNAHQALLALPAGPRRLYVASRLQDGRIQLVVTDNGPGIAEDIQNRIFDPFFTTRDFGTGMGLGLSVAYGIVKEHAGEILVESVEGEGATFIIRLPVANAYTLAYRSGDSEPE